MHNHLAEERLLRAVAIRTLVGKPPLSCREATLSLGVGLSTLRRTAAHLEARGLVHRTKAPTTAHTPRNTHLLTLAGDDLIAVLDLTQPTLEYRLFSSALLPCGVGSMIANHHLSAPDHLALLAHRIALLRCAVDPDRKRPLTVTLLLPDSPPTTVSPSIPFADLADHPHRYTEALSPLHHPDNRPPSLRIYPESAAIVAALHAHPDLRACDTLLYLRLSPTPRALLCLRPFANHPFHLHPCGAPLTETLLRYVATDTDPLPDALIPLRRFLRDLFAFCHPDTLLLEGAPADLEEADIGSAILPTNPHAILWPQESSSPTAAQSGALLSTLASLWSDRLSAPSPESP